MAMMMLELTLRELEGWLSHNKEEEMGSVERPLDARIPVASNEA